MTLLGVFGMQPKILLPKIIHNSNEILLCFFEKWPQVTLLDVEWVELS